MGLQLVRLTPVRPTYIDIIFRSKQFRNTSSAILPKIGNLNEIYPHAPRPLVPRVPHASAPLRQRLGAPPRFPTLDVCFPTTHECFPTLDDVSTRSMGVSTRSMGVSIHSMVFPYTRWCFHTLDGCFNTLDGCFPTLDGCLPKRTRTRGTRSFVVSVDLDMGYILQEILKIYKNFFYFFENFSKKKVLKKIIFLF